jgi:4-hydroxybenzoate polyprenyltransferase
VALLVYEHLTVRRWGTSRIALAFFALNGVISCLVGALGVIDVLINW